MASSSKRALPTYGLDAPPSKKAKTQFSLRNPSALAAEASDEDDNNAELDADVIGSNRPNLKRNAVNIDGFDSDSGDERAFDERAAAKAKSEKQRKSKDEEDADMFADLEEDFADGDASDDEVASSKRKKKDVHFLDGDQIEGQVKNSTSGGHVGNRLKLTDQEARYMDEHGVLPASAKIGNDAESSSESEVDDEERAALDEEIDEELGAGAKTRHAPKLDAFNMREEQDEGKFDATGTFIRNSADPNIVHDRWLEGVSSKKDIKRAAEAHQKREDDRRKRDREDDKKSKAEVLGVLIKGLEVGETVLEALARLGKESKKSNKKKIPKWQQKKPKGKQENGHDTENPLDTMDTETLAAHVIHNAQRAGNKSIDPVTGVLADEILRNAKTAEERAATAEMARGILRRAQIIDITAAADLLLSRGHTDIYDMEREMLMRLYQRETGSAWKDPEESQDAEDGFENGDEATKMWEYRWTDARDGGTVNGPYDATTMKQWNEAGYFQGGIEFRPAGSESGSWSAVAGFV